MKKARRTYNLKYIHELYTLEREIPGLLTDEQKKYLDEFKKRTRPLFEWIHEGKKELVCELLSMKLPNHREMHEVNYLWETGDPRQILTLVENEINWFEKHKEKLPTFPLFVCKEEPNKKLTRQRYKNDPLGMGGYWLLLLKEGSCYKRDDVISWWEDHLTLSRILTDNRFVKELDIIEKKLKYLIDTIKKLFRTSKPWKYVEKVDSNTLNIVKRYMYNSLFDFITINYPRVAIKTGKTKNGEWHRLDPRDKYFKEMISAFIESKYLPRQALNKIDKKSRTGSAVNARSITVRSIVNLITWEKYDISDRTDTRKSMRTTSRL